MDVYVLPGHYADAFCKLCESVRIKPGVTAEDLMEKGGFTNFSKPWLYFHRWIKQEDKYPVSFGICIQKKTMRIREMKILDENFGQPHFCTKNEYEQCKKYIEELVGKGLLERR